jgi:hypothetical protein
MLAAFALGARADKSLAHPVTCYDPQFIVLPDTECTIANFAWVDFEKSENNLCRRANHVYDFADCSSSDRPDIELSQIAALSPDGIFPRLPTPARRVRKTGRRNASGDSI